ncbi:hypothetical protein EV44_g1750 [Erysiphe necator]|uniref:Integrase zinc-binding domain-containing protein n=1 Tax=Uncinula necator TaxID=52586 RepID=A0A0B1P5F9_UNCNE|nr:hypothetical protein EV44_g1750 [Erysiphe necator]
MSRRGKCQGTDVPEEPWLKFGYPLTTFLRWIEASGDDIDEEFVVWGLYVKNKEDERLTDRCIRLLKPKALVAIQITQISSNHPSTVLAIKIGASEFPTDLNLKVSISESSLINNEYLLFRGRKWVPERFNLRTELIQKVHDSPLSGHPGRELNYALVARQFFLPGMAKDIRTFVGICNEYERNKAWRSRRQGFLKPLPIPDHIWSKISIDFIIDLPKSGNCINMIFL